MDDERLLDLLLRWEEEAERGRPVSAEDLCRDCTELVGPLKAKIEALGKTAWMTRPVGDPDEGSPVGASPSRVLAERYRLEELLGEGGFGQVWRAFDTVLHRHVAVKIPKPSRPLAPAQVELFLAEARKLAALDIPGVVPVYDAQSEGAGYFIVTRLVPGADLGRCLEMGRFSSPAEVARIVGQIARILTVAHTRGFVHRDLKPSNILVDDAGLPHLCDFGIAATERELLEGQVRPGTLAYSSPEEVRGGPVDARSDIWSLGVVLFQLLSGRLPFGSDNPAAVRDAILSGAHPPLRSVAPAVPPALGRHL